MPLTRHEAIARCDAYAAAMTAGDPSMTVQLFAEDATHEEPIGTPTRHGREEILAFLEGNAGVSLTMVRIGPVTVVGNHAAFQARVDVPTPDGQLSLTATDLITFDDAGLIGEIVVLPDIEADPGS
ncbi:MAG: nuclear transport factor 2 family protein [Nocardioides sp.]|nr:nuclear transport factor 2 family protein [Nocardioides sp.]